MQRSASAFGLAVGEHLLVKHPHRLAVASGNYGDPLIDKAVELLSVDGFRVTSSLSRGFATIVRLEADNDSAEIFYNREPHNENFAPNIRWKSGQEQRAACYIDEKLKLGVQASLKPTLS